MSSQATSGAVYRVLQKLEGVKTGEGGWTARCPAHPDREASLSVGQGDDGRVLLKCFAGCSAEEIVAAIGLAMADLFENSEQQSGRRSKRASNKDDADETEQREGLTVAEYAEAKGLPLPFLRGLGLKDFPYFGAGAVRIPYRDEDDTEIAVRFRLSLTDEPRLVWKSGSKAQLYGLWRLKEARAAGTIVLCEGESDTHTLWLHDIPAIGLPGADTWKEDWAGHLDGIDRILVVIEPDRGGEAVMRWLERSAIRHRVSVIQMTAGGPKDPSSLYLSNPAGFRAVWQARTDAAVPWQVIEAAAREERRRAEWEACQDLARDPDILTRFADDLGRCGVVGEQRTAQIVYLAALSRRFDRPVSLALKGPSSAGKSFTVERALDFFPPSAYHALTAMSERSLAYSDEPLSHRMLVLYEAAGMSGDFASYLIRSLLSEGRLRYETVEKTRTGMRARLIEREGPTGLIVTTTAVHLHPENETRMLTLPVMDTPDQTRHVMRALADEDRTALDMREWHALQRWIDAGPTTVTVPFAKTLADLIPPVAVRLRRDFRAVLTLIRAHALLHQASRERTNTGAIVATIDDYIAVRELVADIVAEGLEASVPETVRETVEAVRELLAHKGEGDTPGDSRAQLHTPSTTVLEVARHLRIDRSAAQRRLKESEDRGFLKNLEEKRGKPGRFVLGEPLPVDRVILPAVADLGDDGCAGVHEETEGYNTQPPADEPRDPFEDVAAAGYPRVTLPDGRTIEGAAAWSAYLAPLTLADRRIVIDVLLKRTGAAP